MSGAITRNWRLPTLVDPTQPGPGDLYTPLLVRWGAAPGAPDPGAPGAPGGGAQSQQLGALLAQFAPGTAHIGDVLARLGGVPTQLEAMGQQIATDPEAAGGLGVARPRGLLGKRHRLRARRSRRRYGRRRKQRLGGVVRSQRGRCGGCGWCGRWQR